MAEFIRSKYGSNHSFREAFNMHIDSSTFSFQIWVRVGPSLHKDHFLICQFEIYDVFLRKEPTELIIIPNCVVNVRHQFSLRAIEILKFLINVESTLYLIQQAFLYLDESNTFYMLILPLFSQMFSRKSHFYENLSDFHLLQFLIV